MARPLGEDTTELRYNVWTGEWEEETVNGGNYVSIGFGSFGILLEIIGWVCFYLYKDRAIEYSVYVAETQSFF